MQNRLYIANQILCGVIIVIIANAQSLSAPNAQGSIYSLLGMGLNAWKKL
jgi:hypothetical protein